VMSRTTLDAHIRVPAASRIGELVTDTWVRLHSGGVKLWNSA
jgi:hypothetical protein